MGAGASLYSLPDPYDFDVLLPALRDPEGTWAKLGNPEGLTKDEWASAADGEGVAVARFFAGQLDRMYAWADRDRDGTISKADFLWFAAKTVRAAEIPRVDLDDVMTNGLASYLGPIEATHNFRKALSAIKRRPACAQVTRPGSDGWLPIHTILTLQDPVRACPVARARARTHTRCACLRMYLSVCLTRASCVRGPPPQAKAKHGEPREAAKAARIAALPVLEALCKAYPMGASKRVMAGLNYLWPWGHTALDLGEHPTAYPYSRTAYGQHATTPTD